MLIVGLTGGIGSGKSAASACFEAHGVCVVDADVVAREVVEPGEPALAQIQAHFGGDILDSQGALDRAKLRQEIFSSPKQKQWLETLLHPLIRERIVAQLKAAKSSYAILVSPLLFETNQNELVHRSLMIDVSPATQIQRAMARDNNSSEQIKAIMAVQMPREQKLALADDVIINEAGLNELGTRIKALHQFYLDISHEH